MRADLALLRRVVLGDDNVLVREGDHSDSLVVLVEGSVRVVHIDPDGAEQLIRTYESGDHIGELAALRKAPRAATVIAESDGVRGLVIEGAALIKETAKRLQSMQETAPARNRRDE